MAASQHDISTNIFWSVRWVHDNTHPLRMLPNGKYPESYDPKPVATDPETIV